MELIQELYTDRLLDFRLAGNILTFAGAKNAVLTREERIGMVLHGYR